VSGYHLDDLWIDLARQRVERGGVALNVAGLSFQLLRYFLEQGDRVIGFDELIDQVWAPAVVNEETVTQRVKLLRQALGDDGRNPRYLRSVRGRGYQLCSVPKAAVDADASTVVAAEVAEVAGTRATAATVSTPIRKRWIAWVFVLLALITVLLWWRGRDATHNGADSVASDASALHKPGQTLIERASYYASIGQRDNNERAIALYKQALAEKPNDASVLLGLSRAYSARVCLYNFSPDWAAKAQALAEQAIAQRADDAAAYAALGYAQDCRGRLDEALAGYERALQLDPALDATRASAAYLYDRKGRLADALIANTSLRGDPARVRFLELQIAGNLDLLGYPQAAEARYRRSFTLYPDNVYSNIAWPRFLFRQGRSSEAQDALNQAMARGTEHADLHILAAELALIRGDGQAATEALRKAAALRPQASLPATLLGLHAGKTDPGWARQRAQELTGYLEQEQGNPSDWLEIVQLQMAAGDRPAALAALDKAVTLGYSDIATLRVSPLFRQLADDPAFAQAIDRIAARINQERRKVPPALLEKLTASP